jgi:hypothetical protein
MAGVFGSRERRFTIDDAFEEENDEAIRVYGSTTERSPLKPKNRNMISEDSIIVRIEDPIRSASTITSTAPRLKTSDDVSFIPFDFMNVQEQCVHSLRMTFL